MMIHPLIKKNFDLRGGGGGGEGEGGGEGGVRGIAKKRRVRTEREDQHKGLY
jgi:hypothetical protein